MRVGKAMGGLKPPIVFYCIVQCLWNIIFQDPENAIAFSDKRNLWPNTASKLAVQILTYTKGYASVLSSQLFLVFGSNLAFAPKIKTKCIFREEACHEIPYRSYSNFMFFGRSMCGRYFCRGNCRCCQANIKGCGKKRDR